MILIWVVAGSAFAFGYLVGTYRMSPEREAAQKDREHASRLHAEAREMHTNVRVLAERAVWTP